MSEIKQGSPKLHAQRLSNDLSSAGKHHRVIKLSSGTHKVHVTGEKTHVFKPHSEGTEYVREESLIPITSFEEYLEEAIRVDGHDRYKFTHGKRPGGEGNWFIGVGHKNVDFQKHKEGEHYIQHNGKLSDALKKAKEAAKLHKQHTVYIQT